MKRTIPGNAVSAAPKPMSPHPSSALGAHLSLCPAGAGSRVAGSPAAPAVDPCSGPRSAEPGGNAPAFTGAQTSASALLKSS